MIDDLNPYDNYRESGLPWLGQVPAHWSIRRIKTILREADSRSVDGSGTLLSLTRLRGLIPRTDLTDKVHSAKTLVGYKTYASGQLVMNRMQAWSGMFGAGTSDGLVSPDYAVFDLLGGYDIRLVLERIKAPDLVSQFALESKGIGSGFNRLYTDRFGSIHLSLPPANEQVSIVLFLAWATGRLERTIRAKRKVVSLLNEQKQAIIQRAVTLGNNPAALKKPSGIPWIGDIPAHWVVQRAKYIYREADDRSADGSEELLSVSHITGVTPRSQKNITMFKAASYTGHKLCRPGDLVVNTMWAWMGALGVSEYTGIISPAYAVYRPYHPNQLVGEYIDGLLRSRPYISNIICRSTGLRASRLRLYPEEFFRLPLILPPPDEQHQIVASIQVETAKLTKSILRYQREIQLLREYRTRLVADVVTGKLDVREAVAALPDEVLSLDNVVEEDLSKTDEVVEEFAEEGLDN